MERKRFLAVVMTVMMVISMIPSMVFAAAPSGELGGKLKIKGLAAVGVVLSADYAKVTPEEVTELEKTSDIFLERIQTDTSADWKAEKLSVVSSRDMTRMAAGETQNAETIESRADAAQLYRLAKGFLQAVADSSGK